MCIIVYVHTTSLIDAVVPHISAFPNQTPTLAAKKIKTDKHASSHSRRIRIRKALGGL